MEDGDDLWMMSTRPEYSVCDPYCVHTCTKPFLRSPRAPQHTKNTPGPASEYFPLCTEYSVFVRWTIDEHSTEYFVRRHHRVFSLSPTEYSILRTEVSSGHLDCEWNMGQDESSVRRVAPVQSHDCPFLGPVPICRARHGGLATAPTAPLGLGCPGIWSVSPGGLGGLISIQWCRIRRLPLPSSRFLSCAH